MMIPHVLLLWLNNNFSQDDVLSWHVCYEWNWFVIQSIMNGVVGGGGEWVGGWGVGGRSVLL